MYRAILLNASPRNTASCTGDAAAGPSQKPFKEARLPSLPDPDYNRDVIVVLQAASVGGIVLDTCKSVTLKGAATLTYQMDQYPYVQVDPATIC